MDEFNVIKIMNEATLRLKRSKGEDFDVNNKIKRCLEDREFFYKIKKETALRLLICAGVNENKLEETYQKLVSKKINDTFINNFYKEVCQNLKGDYKIILEPGRELKEDWIEYDTVKWEIEDRIEEEVDKLKENKNLSIEEKIIKLYEDICMKYIYDANVLYFFKRDTSDIENIKYIAVDWYGRIVDYKWIEKRKKHNRRICYEFARFYAKAINELAEKEDGIEAFMLGDKENTHYVVGLTGEKYSVILDQDDFNSIKDLTRLKMGLTIKGIHILRDETGIFKQTFEKFNENRPVELKEIEDIKRDFKEKDFIVYLNKAIEIINKYNIDSQGFFEYIRFLIEEADIKIEKIWKEDIGAEERRYERCLYFELNGNTYLLDSIDKNLTAVNINNLDKNIFIFNSEENQYEYYGG